MISIKDIQQMQMYPSASKFGYFGAGERDESTDLMLIEAAHHLSLTKYELLLWLNSSYARKFMDPEKPKSSKSFIGELGNRLPELKEEMKKLVLKLFEKEYPNLIFNEEHIGFAAAPFDELTSVVDKSGDHWSVWYDYEEGEVHAVPKSNV